MNLEWSGSSIVLLIFGAYVSPWLKLFYLSFIRWCNMSNEFIYTNGNITNISSYAALFYYSKNRIKYVLLRYKTFRTIGHIPEIVFQTVILHKVPYPLSTLSPRPLSQYSYYINIKKNYEDWLCQQGLADISLKISSSL